MSFPPKSKNYKYMHQDINRELLFLHWAGLSTSVQRSLISNWLEDLAHQEKYAQWLMEWEEQYPHALSNTEEAWNLLNQQLKECPTPKRVTVKQTTTSSWQSKRSWWLIASSLVLAVSVGITFRENLFFNTYITRYGQIKTVVLSDGSEATLNSSSELKVPKFFNPFGDRAVYLIGDADFRVQHLNESRRFIVSTASKMDVVVLGTEFYVTTRNKLFQVALHSGKVVLQPKDPKDKSEFVTLKPGDVASLSSEGSVKLITHQATRRLVKWKKRLFLFDHHSLKDVLTMIQEQFGESIILENNSLANFQITGRFGADQADELMAVICELTGYHVVVRNQQKYLVE